MTDRRPGPLFVVGCPRSGTTLLRLVLNCHPRLAIAPESSFLFRYRLLLGLYGDLGRERNLLRLAEDLCRIRRVREWFPGGAGPGDVLARARAAGGGFAAAAGAVFAVYAAAQGKEVWGDKTPRNLFQVPLLLRLYPAARVVVLLRDGRDVALSLNQAEFSGAPVPCALLLWRRYARFGAECRRRYPDRVLEVKYEDFTARPAAVTAAILEFAGLEPDPGILEKYRTCPDDVGHVKSRLYRQPIVPNFGRWRERLSPAATRFCERLAGPELAAAGYPLVHPPAERPPLSRAAEWKLKARLFLAHLANREYRANYVNFLQIVGRRLRGK